MLQDGFGRLSHLKGAIIDAVGVVGGFGDLSAVGKLVTELVGEPAEPAEVAEPPHWRTSRTCKKTSLASVVILVVILGSGLRFIFRPVFGLIISHHGSHA